MANAKTREKRRAARLNKRLLAQKQADEELDNEELDDLEDEEEVLEPAALKQSEQVEKDYMDPSYYGGGATSWEEADQLEAAQEQADTINEVSWTARDLVRSIVISPMMSPDEKAKAIADVGKGFGQRIKAATSPVTKKEIDIELLQIEALMAKDWRHMPFMEKLGDWIEKKKLTSAAENSLSDSDFALVKEENGKKVRKYPIHDKAHVRNALARAAQQIKAGGAGAADAKAALPKIHAAAKKMGIGTVEKSSNSVIVEKAADGNWRWLGWPSNNFKDLDNDIISEVAHKEYVDWVSQNMDIAPVFLCHHIPGTIRKDRVDFVDYVDGFLIMSGPLTETEAAGLFRVQKETDLGMSHGTLVLARDQADPRVITKYRMVEVSDLPLDHAANPFTDFETLTKEADMDTKKYLASILGSDEEAEKFLGKTGLKQKALQDAGVENKAKSEETPATQTTVVNNTAPADLDSIVKAVSEQLDIPGLNEFLTKLKEDAEKVPVLEALVKEMSSNQDEKLAALINPKAATRMVWQKEAASQSQETVLKEDDEKDKLLKESVPQVSWLNQATNSKPLVPAQ